MFREPQSDFLVVGDVHGFKVQIERAITHAHELGLDTVFQVGDYGIWDNDRKFLDGQQKLLEKYGMELYFIDGNHENFVRLYETETSADGTRFIRDNITHIPRGYRWEWKGMTFLALGGAASIDRKLRREGFSWWPEEYITEEDVLTAQSGGPVDVMFTHDSPAGAPNSVTDDMIGQLGAMEYYGAEMLANCTTHRAVLKQVTDVTIPRILMHGHYHKAMEGIYAHGDSKNTTGFVRGLDEGSTPLEKYTTVFSFDEARAMIEKLDTIKK